MLTFLFLGLIAAIVLAAIPLEQAAEGLSENALTVRAQTVSPNDDGKLLWDTLFEVPPEAEQPTGLELNEITTLDYRPATDRRELNARGRHIPVKTPAKRNVVITPIEGYARINEGEMYQLNAAAGSNAERRLELIGAKLPARVKSITLGNFRRLELDAFEAWLKGQITQRNPQNAAQTYVASLNLTSGLIQTAGTAWNDSGVNAWTEHLAWLTDGMTHIGAIDGSMMRQATFNAIRADAPTGIGGAAYSRADLEKLIQDEIGGNFAFFINERTVDLPDDGGDSTTRTKVFPAQRVGAIPAGGIVGKAYFAPVIRAEDVEGVSGNLDYSDPVPVEDINLRLNRVFYERGNGGRTITAEVQLNGLCVPSDSSEWVINAGV